MKKFKFLNDNNQNQQHNGVTNQYLIQLSTDIWSFSDWVYTSMLEIDEDSGQDSLIFEFNDIDQSTYWCKILQDSSFEVLQLIKLEDGTLEYLDAFMISNEVRLDHKRLLNYLQNMPKTITSLL